jgi:hypothetical protein
MLCGDFLRFYSEYRDGLIWDPALQREIRDHLTSCRRCMNYDAYVSRGVMLLRATSDIGPSARFARRLERRLRAEGHAARLHARAREARNGMRAVLMTAAALTLVVGVTAITRDRSPTPRAATPTAGQPLPATTSVASQPTLQRPTVARNASHQTMAPPFVPIDSGSIAVNLTDQSVPAFTRKAAAPESQVSFATWVSVAR